MPIYEYECRKCKAHLEVFQKINDKPPAKCRKCGGRLEKMLSVSAIQFKGSGWYVTDYADKGKKAAAKSESESSGSSDEKKAEKKSKESSPATKSSDKSSTNKPKAG